MIYDKYIHMLIVLSIICLNVYLSPNIASCIVTIVQTINHWLTFCNFIGYKHSHNIWLGSRIIDQSICSQEQTENLNGIDCLSLILRV